MTTPKSTEQKSVEAKPREYCFYYKDQINPAEQGGAEVFVLKYDYQSQANLLEVMAAALEFYADNSTWKDTWKMLGKESEDFKYFMQIRTSSKDTENISTDGKYHFVAGKRARQALAQYKKHKEKL